MQEVGDSEVVALAALGVLQGSEEPHVILRYHGFPRLVEICVPEI